MSLPRRRSWHGSSSATRTRQRLINCFLDIDVTALMASAMRGHLDTLDQCLQLGAEAGTKLTNGWTVLDGARVQGQEEAARMLAEYEQLQGRGCEAGPAALPHHPQRRTESQDDGGSGQLGGDHAPGAAPAGHPPGLLARQDPAARRHAQVPGAGADHHLQVWSRGSGDIRNTNNNFASDAW